MTENTNAVTITNDDIKLVARFADGSFMQVVAADRIVVRVEELECSLAEYVHAATLKNGLAVKRPRVAQLSYVAAELRAAGFDVQEWATDKANAAHLNKLSALLDSWRRSRWVDASKRAIAYADIITDIHDTIAANVESPRDMVTALTALRDELKTPLTLNTGTVTPATDDDTATEDAATEDVPTMSPATDIVNALTEALKGIARHGKSFTRDEWAAISKAHTELGKVARAHLKN